MNRVRFAIIALSAAGLTSAHAVAPNMREGLWEVTAQVDGPQASGVKPTTVQHCMTQNDLKNPQKIVPAGNGECEIRDHKVQGNVVSWSMICKGKAPLTGTGSITFGETTYTGNSTLTVTRGDRTEKMVVRYAGKYVGPCRK